MAYEDLYGNPVVATTDDLSQNPWINNFATQGALTGLQYLGGMLSKPKNALFGFAGGLVEGDPLQAVKELGNLIPFSDTVGLTNTPGGILTEKPVEGRDLLRKMGVVGQEDNAGNFAAGLALDILGDPLNFFTGPAGALTKAGKAAEKTGTLPSTILGRIKAAGGPMGGWIGVMDRPWYAETLGFGPQQTVATLGTGKVGEAIASGLEKGVSAATRFTIPGTDFSPIGALRSAFQKGSGNTGYGPIVDEFGGGYGKTNVGELTGEMATASRKAAFPTVELQSKAYNDLLMTGLAEEDIAPILNRAAVTNHELLGRMKLPPNLSPQQESIVRQYADDFSRTVQPIYKSEQQAARELGIQVEDTTSLWGHRYLNRAQAGKGNAAGTAQYQRTGLIKDLPGGQDQFEQLAINPQFSGIATRKAAGQAYDGAAIQAAIDQNAKIIAQDIIAEANQQIPTMRQYGLKVPQRAMDIATNANGAADDLAREVSTYLARLQPDVAERGMFYRQDLGTNAMAYGTNFAAKKAVRTGALNVLAKEGKDVDMLLTKATNASDVVNLKAALDELKMTGAEAELVNRIPGMNSVDDLASRAVPRKLVQKLYEEVNPGEAAPEGFLSKLSSGFRYGVTIPFPANFVRNWTGELADISIAGGNPIKGLKETTSWYNKTLPAVSEIEAVHAAKGASGNMVTYSMRGKPGTEKELLSNLEKLVTRFDPYDPANVTISDIASPLYKRAAEAEKAGIITGVLGTDQTRALLGTGMVGGETMLNYAPVPSMRSTKEIAKDFLRPITSEAARTKMEITPLRELAGVPTGQPPSTIAGKAVAMLGDKVVDPFRGYMGAMETAHAFQNKATRHQQIRQLLDQGYTMEGAAKRVLTTQRNYENLTDFERKFMRNVVPFYNFCVPVSHEILTRDGWKFYDQCTVGEEVMAYNHETEELAWQPIEAINVFDHDGDLLTLKRPGGMNFMFTENHRWPVYTDPSVIKRPYGTYTYPKKKFFVTGDKLKTNHAIPRAGEFKDDGTSMLSPRLAAILGWVVTDGYHRWRGNHCEMVVYQHPKKYLSEVKWLLGTESRARKPHPETGVVCIPVSLNDIKEITSVFKSKEDLPWIVGRLSRTAAEWMWHAMFNAEGTGDADDGKQQMFSQDLECGNNAYVAEAFQMLCMMTGKNLAIRKGYTSHYINRDKGLHISKIGREHYKGKVWCPTTKWGTWVMRHNGHMIITGNSKQNLISQADMMSRNPGRYNAVLSLINSGRSEDSFVPSWASSGTAIPLPGAPEGQQRFLGNLGLPIEDEAIGALGALFSGHPIEAVRRAASSSNPIMKVPYEMATGRQIFSGRDLQDLKPSPVIAGLMGDNQFSRGLTQAITGTPYSRAFSTVDRLANSPEKGVLATLLNLATGIRTVDVDQDRAAGIAARQTVERLLKESGNFKSREMVYLKPELRGQEETLSPEVLQLMQYHQQLLKRAQDAAKLKALEQANR